MINPPSLSYTTLQRLGALPRRIVKLLPFAISASAVLEEMQASGRNLEAYVDDMAIKSKTENEMLADIAKTFDNLRRINKKLNMKKSNLQSPKTLNEMQSLSEKFAALNWFLAKSSKRPLLFFETLKNITKENKDEYRWTEDAEIEFQEMKKLIMELQSLTTPKPEETLNIYLVASQDAVSGVLLAERNGKQTPIQYVSRTLHEAERNYAPLEKLALCLMHLSRRLRRYFEELEG
ncbi:reverse transcriptase domain-containing protein [Tanacetum coccineum]|uniref:Reverse transcriptase domain-containing protein n=1 Tax=Tanacetum coccineum TaxID=301880 RepID=A0ABQ4X013_9ASTR